MIWHRPGASHPHLEGSADGLVAERFAGLQE
jgi:hypothetical protein